MKEPKSTQIRPLIPQNVIKDMLLHCRQKGDLDFMYYLLLLYLTGSRPNEIINIHIKDFNYENSTLTIWMNKVKEFKTVPLNSTIIKELLQLSKLNGLNNGSTVA